MRAVPITSGQPVFSALKNAVLGAQAVVAGRLAAVLPVTEQGAMVGTELVSISIWPNWLHALAVGVRASKHSRVGRELTENALLRECPTSRLSGILGSIPVPPNPLVLPSGLPPWLLSAVLRRAPCKYQVTLVQAMPPMRRDV